MDKNAKNKYQSIFEKFKDHKKTEGFELKNISEIYIPFWYCKQKVVVEKEIAVDRFSKIILELINSEITTHSEICDFLGIKENDFTIMQFHYLLKNEMIEDSINNGSVVYEITHKGISFLKGKDTLQNIETIDFEYFYNDLSMDYFNPNELMDKNVSKSKRKEFSGYKLIETHKIMDNKIQRLERRNKPSLNRIKQSDFASYFNSQKSDMTFYDFGSKDLKTHKRSILFLKLEYENNESQKECEIRQFKNSVNKFIGNELEESMSLDLMKNENK